MRAAQLQARKCAPVAGLVGGGAPNNDVVRILALDGALAGCSVAITEDGSILAQRRDPSGSGGAIMLAPMAAAVLAQARLSVESLDGVAVTIGPGSFTGLRAAIALAQGIAFAAGQLPIGVTVAEAMAEALPHLGGRTLWVAIDSRRNRIFLDRGKGPEALGLSDLPPAEGRVAVAGDAAIEVAARLAARGDDVMLTDLRGPPIRQVALVAASRLRGERPPLTAQPLYVDAPEAKLPTGLRPPPAP